MGEQSLMFQMLTLKTSALFTDDMTYPTKHIFSKTAARILNITH